MAIGGNTVRGRSQYGGRAAGPIDSVSINRASPSFSFNPGDVSADISVRDGGLTIVRGSAAAAYRGCRSTVSRAQSGIVMASFWPGADSVDWDRTESTVGLSTAAYDMTTAWYTDNTSMGWSPNGAVYINAALASTIRQWNIGDQLDCVWDFGNSRFWGRVNGGYWNASSTATPSTNTGGIALTMAAGAVYTFACLYSPGAICRSRYVQVAAPAPPSGVIVPWGLQ